MSIAAQGSGSAVILIVSYMDPQGDLVVGRFTITEPHKPLDEDSMTVIIKIARLSPHRLGSSLDFGPDGTLYIATSDGEATDGGSTTTRTHAAQLPQSLLGKVIRVRPGERSGYSVPTDNPFIKQSSFQPEIYALGFRAPEAISIAPSGNQIFVLDSNERNNEVNLVERGKNYGWDALDGLECRNKDQQKECDANSSVRPLLALPKGDSNSALVGALLYQGDRYPELRGYLLFADRNSGIIYAASEKSPGIWGHRAITQAQQGSITAIGYGSDGVIYAASEAGRLFSLQ
jgi:glucose/arabinose dehydrogenase